ncbi:MAG: hypothetical protein Ta2G_21680 [Termitinemataceae bacterium]|nr:MAG: hypothetical protein Ta2G_21680 [Termitinemataceae bacterium]
MSDKAIRLIESLKAANAKIVFAESCTAGLAANALANISGASSVLWGSYVTYADEAKVKMLGVPKKMIDEHGAVSSAVAEAMAEGALQNMLSSGQIKNGLAVSLTGLAGPNGDGSNNPIGTVWIALYTSYGKRAARHFCFSGTRQQIREAAVEAALDIAGANCLAV